MLPYYCDSAGAIGGLRPSRFCRYLSQLGYNCTAITAFPDEANTSANFVYIPDKVGELWESGAASSTGAPRPKLSLAAHVERALRKLFLPGHTGFAWSVDASAAAQAILREIRYRNAVLFSPYPPLGNSLAALQIALRHWSMPWIVDFHDPLRFEPFLKHGALRTRLAVSILERVIFRRANAIIANTEAAAAEWRKLYPWAQEKLHVIWNGFDPQERLDPLPIPPRSEKVIVHAGALYGGRNANAVIGSLARLRERGAIPAGSVRLLLVGVLDPSSGADRVLHDRGVQEGWLETRKPVSKVQARQLVQQADGLLLLQPQSALQVPAKLYDYIRIGRPILSVAPRGSPSEWILQNSGIPYAAIHSEDPPDALDAKMLQYLALPNTPTEPSEWFRQRFDASAQARQLASIVDGLARP